LKLLDDAGAQDFCTQLAQQRADKALAMLDRASLTRKGAANLHAAAVFLLERDF